MHFFSSGLLRHEKANQYFFFLIAVRSSDFGAYIAIIEIGDESM